LASDAIEGSAVVAVVVVADVDVLPTGEEFGGGGGRPIGLYGIIGIGAGAGAILAPLP
jgi:hypothetical protein